MDIGSHGISFWYFFKEVGEKPTSDDPSPWPAASLGLPRSSLPLEREGGI